MARKKKKNQSNNKPTDIATLEATAKKLQSLLVRPDIYGFVSAGTARGVREKILSIDYLTIRNVVHKVPLINAVINTRVEQVKKFCKYTVDPSKPGFTFVPADPTAKTKKENAKELFKLSEFLDQTGYQYDSDREDDFADYIEMFVRETLTIDQVATELQRNRRNDIVAFWLLDGATIHRINPKEFKKNHIFQVTDKTRFCQMIEQQIYNVYTDEDLVFDYKNKRADIRFRGFGYSPTEMAIDLITTLLFGYTYARDQLMRDRVPKGFIQVMGDVDRDQLDAIREYWYAAMSGAGGRWNIPILPSGKDGIGLDWKNIQNSNRDMEYHKLMMFMSSIIAAVFSIDMAELGIKADDSTALIGETAQPRLASSRDRGLRGLLEFIEQHINKITRKVMPEYKFHFVGLEPDDEQAMAELRKKEVETRMSVDELREADGLKPFNKEWSKVVLNPQAVQLINAEKQAQAQQQQMEMGGGEEGPGGEEGGEEDPDQGAEVDWEAMFSKSMKEDKKIRIIIE